MPLPLSCYNHWTQPLPSQPTKDGQDGIGMGGGQRATEVPMRRKRGIFRVLIVMLRSPGPPLLIRDDAALCGGCLLPLHDPSAAKMTVAPGMSLAKTTSSGGGGGGKEPPPTTTSPSSFFTITTKIVDIYRKLEEGKGKNSR